MKTKIFFCLFLLLSLVLHSQKKPVDSLIILLNHSKNDVDKVKILNGIANEYKTTNPKMLLEYATKALQLARKINDKIEEGNAYLNIGNSNIILGNYPKAIQFFTAAQTIFENEINANAKANLEIKKGLAKSYGSIGIAFSKQSNYSKSLQFYLKSVKIYEEIKEDAKCAVLYNNIGIIYQSQLNDFKALEYFIKALKINEKLNQPIGVNLTNIANCYLKQKNFDKAFDYYNKARENLVKYPDVGALGEWYNNFGLFFKATKNEQLAIDNWKLAIKTFESIDDKFGKQDSYLYLGQLYFQQNKLVEALNNVSTSLQLSKETGTLEQTMLSEKLISDIYSKQNNIDQAFLHYKLYNQAKDSLMNEENTRKSVEAEMNFEFERREVLHRKELEKKEILLREEAKRSKMQLFFAALFGILIFSIGFLIYNRKQLKKRLILQKELAEYEQKALHLQMNPHFVFNCLGSISSFIVNNGTESAIKYLAKFSKLMRLTLEYSKESLIPIHKEIEALQNYLELEQLRFNQKFDFSIFKSEEIEDDMSIPPLLLQPFIENAIIHGVIPKKASGLISIRFVIENESLVCVIEDNGVGFQNSKNLKESSVVVHKSMALDIIKKRLEMIESGTKKKTGFTIEEIKNNNEILGTRVVLNLPIQYTK